MRDDLHEKVLTPQDANVQLLQAQDYELRAAALAERARIAREIHDSVGHLLARLLPQIKALQVVYHKESGAVADYPAFQQVTADDGSIVPAEGEPTAASRGDSSLGLHSVTERVEALGGRVRITPQPRFTVLITTPKGGQGKGETS